MYFIYAFQGPLEVNSSIISLRNSPARIHYICWSWHNKRFGRKNKNSEHIPPNADFISK